MEPETAKAIILNNYVFDDGDKINVTLTPVGAEVVLKEATIRISQGAVAIYYDFENVVSSTRKGSSCLSGTPIKDIPCECCWRIGKLNIEGSFWDINDHIFERASIEPSNKESDDYSIF